MRQSGLDQLALANSIGSNGGGTAVNNYNSGRSGVIIEEAHFHDEADIEGFLAYAEMAVASGRL
jgi:hypothetical protein